MLRANEVHTPLILAVAPNGARLSKSDHAALPMAAEEIADEAQSCAEAGATLLHLHVRDCEGNHTLDSGMYKDTIAAVKEKCGDRLIIQITTEAVGIYSPKEQIDVIRDVKPEAFSVSIMELIPDDSHIRQAAEFFQWVAENGIHTQHILYSPRELDRLHDLIRQEVVKEASLLPLFVCGRYGRIPGDVDQLTQFIDKANDVPWMSCAFGESEAVCARHTIQNGGHCRIGFENNILRDDGSKAANNAEQIETVACLAQSLGRPLASVHQAREMLGL